MTQFSSLFSPGKIGTLKIKNRVVMPPMVRNYADEKGLVTPEYVAHIERIARGGVGAMVLEASFIRPDGRGFSYQLGVHTDDCIPGLKQLVKVAHAHEVVIGPQIFHAGRQTTSKVTGTQPVAPSAIPDPTINEMPRSLGVEEIRDIVEDYAQAAWRAKEAGCDFVEIHGAHGYLITQFLSPFSNYRDDQYGGSEEGRMRFPSEVLRAVRKAVGSEFPVTMRISADEMVPNGLTPDDSIKIAKRLEELGADAIHVSVGNYASFNRGYMISPMDMPEAPLVPIAERIKRSVRVPVIAVGKIRSPSLANEVIQKGKADFVAVGRSLLADPDWPKKAQEGRVDEIRKCIACNQGCISRLFAGEDVWCTVNPETSREMEFARPLPDAKKRVFIAGGGPAGMEAARIATLRGHKVVLFEEHDSLGGALILSAMLPYRTGWAELRDYLTGELNRLGVDVRLGTRATAELAKREGAEVAIVAVGAAQFRVDIPGTMQENVLLSRDILEGKARVLGKKVVVIGSGVSGAQIADFLAEKGYDITIAAAGGEIAKSAAVVIRNLLLERLKQRGVKILVNTKILGIEKGKVLIKGPSGTESLSADTVVVSLGIKPNDSIASELQAAAKQVIVVGDAVEPRDATYAMVEGARAGLSI